MRRLAAQHLLRQVPAENPKSVTIQSRQQTVDVFRSTKYLACARGCSNPLG